MSSKRTYSPERKQELINEYLNSNLSKAAFQKKYSLPNSFYSWFEKSHNNDFVELSQSKVETKLISFNLIMNLNQKLELSLALPEAISLIRGLMLCN